MHLKNFCTLLLFATPTLNLKAQLRIGADVFAGSRFRFFWQNTETTTRAPSCSYGIALYANPGQKFTLSCLFERNTMNMTRESVENPNMPATHESFLVTSDNCLIRGQYHFRTEKTWHWNLSLGIQLFENQKCSYRVEPQPSNFPVNVGYNEGNRKIEVGAGVHYKILKNRLEAFVWPTFSLPLSDAKAYVYKTYQNPFGGYTIQEYTRGFPVIPSLRFGIKGIFDFPK